jgi:alpha-tubulin suppressor-like RCC1 family protein
MARVLLAACTVAASLLVGPASPSSAASGWTSLSSGGNHTCGIRNGRIYCWGYDEFGQLGDGTAGGTRPVPAQILSGATDWTSVSAGTYHTCAIRVGRIACWGYDGSGQLGDGTSGVGADPIPNLIASGAADWKTVSAGENHTCAIRIGRVACWGGDQSGQLGDGTVSNPQTDPTPGFISSGATDWTSVSAGAGHTCAIRAGRVACWGFDGAGQLGDGTVGSPTTDPSPSQILSGATDWKTVSAGLDHTCATRAGRIACWGGDGTGQLGDGTVGNPDADPSPGLISSGATDWTSVSAGASHTCATRVGRVACWGSDGYGQLGDGTAGNTGDPSPGFILSGASDWKRVDVGAFHTCAIRATLLACWGNDATGQLGDGTVGSPQVDPTPSLEAS